jgi:hypothetical protein
LQKAATEAVVAAGTGAATSLGGFAGSRIGGLLGIGADRICFDLTSADTADALGRVVAGMAVLGATGALTPLKQRVNARLMPRGDLPCPAQLDLCEIAVGMVLGTARTLIVTAFVPPGYDVVVVLASASSAFLSTAIANVLATRLDRRLSAPDAPDPWFDERTTIRAFAGVLDAGFGGASLMIGRMLRSNPTCRYVAVGLIGTANASIPAIVKRFRRWAEPLEMFLSGGHHGVHGTFGV